MKSHRLSLVRLDADAFRRALIVGGLVLMAAFVHPARAAEEAADAAALRDQVLAATWPADIVRLSQAYVDRYPHSDFASDAQRLRDRATATAQLLGDRGTKLQRSAFRTDTMSPDQREILRQAALGDRSAAVELAHTYAHDGAASAAAQNRYVGWMQYAALLGDKTAAYAVALYYRDVGEPAIAAVYQSRAEALGYVAPHALDNVRK